MGSITASPLPLCTCPNKAILDKLTLDLQSDLKEKLPLCVKWKWNLKSASICPGAEHFTAPWIRWYVSWSEQEEIHVQWAVAVIALFLNKYYSSHPKTRHTIWEKRNCYSIANPFIMFAPDDEDGDFLSPTGGWVSFLSFSGQIASKNYKKLPCGGIVSACFIVIDTMSWGLLTDFLSMLIWPKMI
jgi:hypothetical protein